MKRGESKHGGVNVVYEETDQIELEIVRTPSSTDIVRKQSDSRLLGYVNY